MTNKIITSVAAGALFASVAAFAPIASAQDTMQPAQPNATDSTAPAAQPMTPAPMDGAANSTAPAADQAAQAAPAGGDYLTEQGPEQISANTYIGQSVYTGNDESIGEINDVIFTTDGSVEAAVIGVGGFLGIGEKNVAVPLDKINVAQVPNSDDLKLTTQETADTLKAAPEFKTKSAQMAEQNTGAPVDSSTTSSTTPGAAPAGTAAPAPATSNN
ncbi:PRC-barrel domain-containing protein [Rhizobium sp. YIM 134829]|uniref:PRC-barrel domain-containing protein n=1 Tax=Rhizobium sp. YIM 134829 TaxID=3390453 RepID=UPI00397BCF1B